MFGKIDDMGIIWHHSLKIWVCRGLWVVVWRCLVLFILAIKSQKILKNVEKWCDPGHIGIVKPNKAKLEIFSKYFFTLCVTNFKSVQKILKMQNNHVIKGMQELWYQTKPNCETNTICLLVTTYKATRQPTVIESGVSGDDQGSLVTFRRLGPKLLVVMNGCQ